MAYGTRSPYKYASLSSFSSSAATTAWGWGAPFSLEEELAEETGGMGERTESEPVRAQTNFLGECEIADCDFSGENLAPLRYTVVFDLTKILGPEQQSIIQS